MVAQTCFFETRPIAQTVKTTMKRLQTIVLFTLICLLAPEASSNDYLIVGTQANGGGAIYEVNGGSLTFIENLPVVDNVPWGARATYYHEANDTL